MPHASRQGMQDGAWQVGRQTCIKGMEIETPDPVADLRAISDTLRTAVALMQHVSINITPEGYAKIVETLGDFVSNLITRLDFKGSPRESDLLRNCLDSLQQARTASERCRGINRFAHVMNCVVRSAMDDTADDLKTALRADGNKTRRMMVSGALDVREDDKRPSDNRALLDTVDKRLRKQKDSADDARKRGEPFYKMTVSSICKNVFDEAIVAKKRISFKSADQLRTCYYNDAPRFGYFLDRKHRLGK